jgi:sugar/nucleoside kinase (ribokinase family)
VTLTLPVRGDRAQVTYLGAISELRERDLPAQLLERHRHLHLTSFALQKRLQPAFPSLLRRARQLGLTTSLDPNSDLRGELRRAILKLLPHVDLLFLNEREARELSGRKTAAEALEALEKQVRGVVLKLGPAGAIASVNGERARARAKRVSAIDTTGAGYSFAGGFVSAFLRGLPLLDCLSVGNACGAASTRALGGTAAQPTLNELRQFSKEASL